MIKRHYYRYHYQIMVQTRSGNDYRDSRCKIIKNWKDIEPSKKERATMPLICFALPEERKYPVCPSGSTEPTAEGVHASYLRARLRRNSKVLKRLEKMRRSLKC